MRRKPVLELTLALSLLSGIGNAKTYHVVLPPSEGVSYRCPSESVLDRFSRFDDVMLGEHHGTNETPAFLKCLVDYLVANSAERVIVSLELPSTARELMSEFWQRDENDDGRGSQAMHQLVRHLLKLEQELKLDLHFQHRSRYFDSAASFQQFKNNPVKYLGEEIRALANKGKMVVLAGNIHTMRYAPEHLGINPDFEGRYVGPTFAHVLI